MTRPIDLMREGRRDELWQMCCGFLDLSLEQFMAMQNRLLEEQIKLLKRSELGRRVMRGAMPETVEEFREQVPLTTYQDYLPDLVEKREDVLPTKPALWVHTVGRIGEYNFKWVPLSEAFVHEFERVAGGVGLLASCNSDGEFVAKEHLKLLATMGTHDYGSGIVAYLAHRALGCELFPANSETVAFQEKMEAGFKEALSEGLDALGGLPSILVFVGEMIRQSAIGADARFLASHPKACARLARALVKSKMARRRILPKDLWSIKVIVGGGNDSAIFRERVEELWGRCPLEIFGGTEGGIYATQTWDHEGLTFIPNLNFFEFIPEREWFKWQLDNSYQPKTVLLDEVKAGDSYEIVITNLHGGILTRCRIGDVIRITSLRNEELGIDIPQMVFQGRADDFVDITGVGRLTERLIRQAMEHSGIPYVDWVARKEIVDNKPVLHLYIELSDGHIANEDKLATTIREQFRKLDKRHRCNLYNLIGNIEGVLGLKPIEVTLLPQGAFYHYISERQAVGVDRNHVNLPHINPPNEVLSSLRAPTVVVEAAPVTEGERAAA
ncbi:MAG: GH3 auxin-responsive promoter family protein [Dehalococcoidia bacterium]